MNKVYYVCRHTCATCICPETQTILWTNKHGTASRHAVDPGPHPDCNEDCDGNEFLNVKRKRNVDALRYATIEETEANRPTPTNNRNEVEPSDNDSFRVLNILYVSDPVQAEPNKHRATGDLGFMNTVISLDEWFLILHLTSHVHGPPQKSNLKKEVRVLIHEWVSDLQLAKSAYLRIVVRFIW